jgi:hypothetical protein
MEEEKYPIPDFSSHPVSLKGQTKILKALVKFTVQEHRQKTET